MKKGVRIYYIDITVKNVTVLKLNKTPSRHSTMLSRNIKTFNIKPACVGNISCFYIRAAA